MQPLPAPSSGLFLEVSFRRLLKSCIEITEGDSKGRADLASWQTSPVFHHVTTHRCHIASAAHAACLIHGGDLKTCLCLSCTVRRNSAGAVVGLEESRCKKVGAAC